jgi:heme/copper-type cytochrome/quinol oxidase subunit 1
MPLFSSYGILTTTMIFMAAAVSLLVLSSLLVLVTPRRTGTSTQAAPGGAGIAML